MSIPPCLSYKKSTERSCSSCNKGDYTLLGLLWDYWTVDVRLVRRGIQALLSGQAETCRLVLRS